MNHRTDTLTRELAWLDAVWAQIVAETYPDAIATGRRSDAPRV